LVNGRHRQYGVVEGYVGVFVLPGSIFGGLL
jgi:hypothetical protein